MKKITILGSAAAEGIPALFCNCRVCTEAWKNGGKDIRHCAAYRLNDRVRIDFGSSSFAQEYQYQLHSENLRHLFITHSHEDHLYYDLLKYRRPGFSVVPEENLLNIYGNYGVWEAMDKVFCGDFSYERTRINPVTLKAFEPVELEEEDMTFIPMKANHKRDEEPHIFAVRYGGKWTLFGNDTGYYPEETWQFMIDRKIRFDVVISDCTGGVRDYRDNHMSGSFVLDTRKRMEDHGIIDSRSRFIINHFSHNGNATHSELEAHYNPYGIEVGFDGMEIEL